MNTLFRFANVARRLAIRIVVTSLTVTLGHVAQVSAANPDPASGRPVVEAETARTAEDSTASPERQWAAAGLSLWLGFGIGHAVEDRFETVGYKYAIADGVGLVVGTVGAIAVMGDCASSQCSRPDATLLRVGVAMLFISRVLQVYDVLSFGVDHGMFGGLAVLPTEDGKGVVTTAAFHF